VTIKNPHHTHNKKKAGKRSQKGRFFHAVTVGGKKVKEGGRKERGKERRRRGSLIRLMSNLKAI